MLMMGHEALGKTHNRNTSMLLNLNREVLGFLKGFAVT